MPEDDEFCNPIQEPKPEEIGFCPCCDAEVFLPDARDGLCAVCNAED